MTTKLIVTTGFIVAFAAGLVTGVQRRPAEEPSLPDPARIEVGPTTGPRGGRGQRMPPPGNMSIFGRELRLSREQSKKMNDIFSEMASTGRELEQRRWTMRQDRDKAIIDLAKAEQKEVYDGILKKYYTESEKIDQDLKALYQSAVDQTKEILNEEQRKRYEEILTRNRLDGRGEGRDGRGGRGGNRGRGDPRDDNDDNRRRNESNPQDNRRAGNSATTRPETAN